MAVTSSTIETSIGGALIVFIILFVIFKGLVKAGVEFVIGLAITVSSAPFMSLYSSEAPQEGP